MIWTEQSRCLPKYGVIYALPMTSFSITVLFKQILRAVYTRTKLIISLYDLAPYVCIVYPESLTQLLYKGMRRKWLLMKSKFQGNCDVMQWKKVNNPASTWITSNTPCMGIKNLHLSNLYYFTRKIKLMNLTIANNFFNSKNPCSPTPSP